MGPFATLLCGAITAALFLVFGYVPWVAGVAAVPWVMALVVAFFTGHRAFKTGANTDLMIVIVGLGVTLAIVVPKFAPPPQ